MALYLGLAFAVNAGFQLLGAALFARTGLNCAATVGLISGNRNIGLAWAAVGSGMPPLVELFFAMSVLPIYMLPALAKPVLAYARRAGDGLPAGASGGGVASLRRTAPEEAARHRHEVLGPWLSQVVPSIADAPMREAGAEAALPAALIPGDDGTAQLGLGRSCRTRSRGETGAQEVKSRSCKDRGRAASPACQPRSRGSNNAT